MRFTRHLAGLALAAAAVAIPAFANAATASATTVPHVLAAQSSSGVFATVTVSVTTHNAQPIIVVVTDSPRQPVDVSWAGGCASGFSSSFSTHTVTFPGPATKVVPESSHNCFWTISADLNRLTPGHVSMKVEQVNAQ
jgi:hypothetical protein